MKCLRGRGCGCGWGECGRTAGRGLLLLRSALLSTRSALGSADPLMPPAARPPSPPHPPTPLPTHRAGASHPRGRGPPVLQGHVQGTAAVLLPLYRHPGGLLPSRRVQHDPCRAATMHLLWTCHSAWPDALCTPCLLPCPLLPPPPPPHTLGTRAGARLPALPPACRARRPEARERADGRVRTRRALRLWLQQAARRRDGRRRRRGRRRARV